MGGWPASVRPIRRNHYREQVLEIDGDISRASAESKADFFFCKSNSGAACMPGSTLTPAASVRKCKALGENSIRIS